MEKFRKTDSKHQQPDSKWYKSDKLVRLPQVLEIVPVSRSCWWSWVASGKAPTPIRLGRCTCWRYSDVIDFIEGGAA